MRLHSILHTAAAALCLALSFWPSAKADIDTRQAIFNPNFRTLTVSVDNDFMTPLILRLNSNDRLNVSFDEISDDYRFLQYRLIHCNADWQPSSLVESEYLRGFNIEDVDDYAFSSNTFVHFVNYRIDIDFAESEMAPTLSGNYLLQVFEQDDPDSVILQARFAVSENDVAVTGNASGRTDRGFNTEWQQLSLQLDPGEMRINNPYQDLKLVVTQNRRPESTRTVISPMRLEGKKVIYTHIPELIFPAGNEYRRFETTRINTPGMHVDSIRYGGSNYHMYLTPDEPRAERNYSYDQTQRGRFLIREYNATDSDLGADYVTVHFTFKFPEVTDGDIYVDGDLTGHMLTDSNRMSYDHEAGVYRLQLPLKQGSYNYQYVIAPKTNAASSGGTPRQTEGNYYETDNEYLVQVFYRPVGTRADRLIGHGLILSNR